MCSFFIFLNTGRQEDRGKGQRPSGSPFLGDLRGFTGSGNGYVAPKAKTPVLGRFLRVLRLARLIACLSIVADSHNNHAVTVRRVVIQDVIPGRTERDNKLSRIR